MLTECSKQSDSLCEMQIPRNTYLIKFHLEKNDRGVIRIAGVYVKQRQGEDEGGQRNNNEQSVRITFLLKENKQRFARSSNIIQRPSNNFQRIKTTPDGLVVIGVIYPTKKSVTKSLGWITPTARPRVVVYKKQQQVNHVFMKVPKNNNRSLNTFVKKVIQGFESVRKQLS